MKSGTTKSITSNSSNVSSDEKDREKIEILTRSTTDQINALQAKKRTTPKTNGMDMIDQKGLELISLETKEFDKSKFSLFLKELEWKGNPNVLPPGFLDSLIAFINSNYPKLNAKAHSVLAETSMTSLSRMGYLLVLFYKNIVLRDQVDRQ